MKAEDLFNAIEGQARKALDKFPEDQKPEAKEILKDLVLDTFVAIKPGINLQS
jgi:hypothetical protein